MFDIPIILTTFFLGFALATARYIGGYKLIQALRAENERLSAELAECQQAAFDNGRAVGESNNA